MSRKGRVCGAASPNLSHPWGGRSETRFWLFTNYAFLVDLLVLAWFSVLCRPIAASKAARMKKKETAGPLSRVATLNWSVTNNLNKQRPPLVDLLSSLQQHKQELIPTSCMPFCSYPSETSSTPNHAWILGMLCLFCL